jgi:hypothetical protein
LQCETGGLRDTWSEKRSKIIRSSGDKYLELTVKDNAYINKRHIPDQEKEDFAVPPMGGPDVSDLFVYGQDVIVDLQPKHSHETTG